ncbi:MAG: 3-hydroxy-3-methylglutaryl CoA synthase [Deltaproteobacteria bacterium]|nr:3-hydroxy-3-methylglutaryl CoA synthase [Deltaproteobacteria bacterium]
MIGITSIGAYVPAMRLDKSAIAKHFRGEKAVANFDEDAITMAVAAGMSALDDATRSEIGALYFASASSPYREKTAATLIGSAIDLPREIRAVDIAHSTRGGTGAMLAALDSVKAGSAKKAMVIASDMRRAKPSSNHEQNFGDGAASLVIGDTDVAVSIEDSYSVSNEMMDMWKGESEEYVRSWETRFYVSIGYMRTMGEAIGGLLKKTGLKPQDIAKAVLYSPDGRSVAGLAKSMGFDPKSQLQDIFFMQMGNTGAAYSLQLLAAALEDAKPGDKIVLASYGNGADAILLQVTDNIDKLKNKDLMKGLLASKKQVPDYVTYLRWRGHLDTAAQHARPTPVSSGVDLWRENEGIIPFHGQKCTECGHIEWPPQRICSKCQALDKHEPVRLSDKRAKLFTHSKDMITDQFDIPMIYSAINFEGGGRMITTVTDKDVEEIHNGMDLEMTFRKKFCTEGHTMYMWKAMPIRLK